MVAEKIFMFEKILVAVDESEVSQQIFAKALSLAKLGRSRLLLVHVQYPFEEQLPNPVFPYESTYPGASAEAFTLRMQEWQQAGDRGLEFLQAMADRAIAAGVDVQINQALGNPGQAICELAKTWQAHLIVVGRRGRTGIREWIGGSVSNYVLHHAPCSVLTIQEQKSVT